MRRVRASPVGECCRELLLLETKARVELSLSSGLPGLKRGELVVLVDFFSLSVFVEFHRATRRADETSDGPGHRAHVFDCRKRFPLSDQVLFRGLAPFECVGAIVFAAKGDVLCERFASPRANDLCGEHSQRTRRQPLIERRRWSSRVMSVICRLTRGRFYSTDARTRSAFGVRRVSRR